jgi:hypothetical protein
MVAFAYADPPYIGQAKKHYGKEDTYGGEVDHGLLLCRLFDEYPDGWALSCSTPSLEEIMCLCREIRPNTARIGAWVKPFCSFKPGVNPAYAWEPVVFVTTRKRARTELTVRDYAKVSEDGDVFDSPDQADWVSHNITLKKGLSGAKPEGFCFWLFDLLGMQPGDTLVDMFPGTGIVSASYAKWQAMKEVA